MRSAFEISFYRAKIKGLVSPSLGSSRYKYRKTSFFVQLGFTLAHSIPPINSLPHFKNQINHQAQPGVVLMSADFPIRLYIVTFVKGSPRIPSWIAQDLKRILLAARGERKGVDASSF